MPMFALLLYFPCWAIMHVLIGIKPRSHLSPWQWASTDLNSDKPGWPREWESLGMSSCGTRRAWMHLLCLCNAGITMWWCFSVCLSSCERSRADWSGGLCPASSAGHTGFLSVTFGLISRGEFGLKKEDSGFCIRKFPCGRKLLPCQEGLSHWRELTQREFFTKGKNGTITIKQKPQGLDYCLTINLKVTVNRRLSVPAAGRGGQSLLCFYWAAFQLFSFSFSFLKMESNEE